MVRKGCGIDAVNIEKAYPDYPPEEAAEEKEEKEDGELKAGRAFAPKGFQEHKKGN
jgi:LAS superfamily LD-carboxypeptidase LdcB